MKAEERKNQQKTDEGEEDKKINGNNERINSGIVKMCVKTSTNMLVSKVK